MVRRAIILSALLSLPGYARSAPLLSFRSEKSDFKTWMKTGAWQSKRDQPAGWAIADGALHLLSVGNSVLIGTQRGFPIQLASAARLRVTLKVKSVPRGTDLSRRSGDDAAFRLYLAFEHGGGMIKPPNTIAYAWTEKDEAGTLIRSGHFSNLWYISLGKGPTRQDEWTTVDRDLAADYRRAFPNETGLPPLKGILLKCDSNDTKTRAESSLAEIDLIQKETSR
jgi:hypothetical protein